METNEKPTAKTVGVVERVTLAIDVASSTVRRAYVVVSQGQLHKVVRESGEVVFESRDMDEIKRRLHYLTSEFYARAALSASGHDEMVAALKALTDAADLDLKNNQDDSEEGQGGGWWSTATVKAIEQARAALARASGKSEA